MNVHYLRMKEPHAMQSIRKRALIAVLIAAMLGLWSATATAQVAPPSVQAMLNVSEYDILFLTDLINVKTQKLNTSVSGFSLGLAVTSPPNGSVDVCVYVEVQVQLRGDAHPQTLLSGITSNFILSGSRTLTARDFARGGSGVAVVVRDNMENSSLRQRIINLAQTTSTAPPGTYKILMKVLPANAQSSSAVVYGEDSKTIIVPYSAVDEVFVEIVDPKDGSYSDNLAPTFSWTTGAQQVTVRVYEVGLNHRSPQDALTGGNPHLVRDLSGVTTLTYPQDANRRLQENRAYVLQVEAKVSTTRGEMGNFSKPVVFRITGDKVGQMLDNFMQAMNDASSATYSALRSEPSNWVAWPLYGNITLDGGILNENDLQALLNELAGRSDLNLQVSVENQ
jgi:hypothetical protein